jgi:PAS domain S-box-containing protein
MSTPEPKAGQPVRVLLLEDSDIDAELLITHVSSAAELSLEFTRVVDRKGFVHVLAELQPDLILADYSLPDFDGLSALSIARELAPETPFIFVSGVVGEEFATNALKRGAVDYVMKRNLRRLPTAVERALAAAREKAERRRAEAALRASEISMGLAVQAAGLGLWDLNPISGALTLDDGGRRLLGVRGQRALTLDSLISLIDPEDRDRIAEGMAAATKPGAPSEYVDEFRVRRPDGAARWLEVRGHAVFEDGVCVRFLGVAQDVTSQKVGYESLARLNTELAGQVEQAHRQRERIFELSQDLFAATGADGYLHVLNPAWGIVLGYDGEALLAHRFLDLVHPDDRATMEAHLAQGRVEPSEVRMLHADGSERWISWTGAAEDEAVYMVGRDVTTDRRAKDELAAAHRQVLEEVAERERVEETLRQLQRLEAVGQLTSGVAHDFNNLLTVIRGNIDFVERDIESAGLDGPIKRRLNNMRIAADRGATLTGQLLAFSRRQRLEPKPVDLNETVRGMRDLLQGTMGGSVRLETVLEAELWPALVDPTQIELIILNLAINARDAMEVGGSLTVETANVTLSGQRRRPEEPDAGDYVVLSVNDTGSGMPPEVLQKAFEPFFTTKPVGRGSGLGLAQVYGFAKQSGGGVGIDTRPGEGTSVRVYLPRASQAIAAEPKAATAKPASVAPEPGCTILLVDDDSAVREVTANMLTDQGYEICEAGSGRAALDILGRRDDIDLMILDYAMPGMSGADTAIEARRLYPQLPILFITGYADLAALKDVGEALIVQKPFRHGELTAKVENLISARRKDDAVVPFPRQRRESH